MITTRQEANSSAYDVYEVEQPPKKVNDALDSLYVSAITDMRKEIPGNKRGRYLSFKKIGLDEVLTDEKIQMLERIVNDVKDSTAPTTYAVEDYEVVDGELVGEVEIKDISYKIRRNFLHQLFFYAFCEKAFR